MNSSKIKEVYSMAVGVLILSWAIGVVHNVAAQKVAGSKHPYSSKKPLLEPTLFAQGIISAGEFDSHPAFTPDGNTLYFVRSTPNFNFWTILVSHFAHGRWSTPEIAPFSGQYSDADPFITDRKSVV